jgi:hypothetical protein
LSTRAYALAILAASDPNKLLIASPSNWAIEISAFKPSEVFFKYKSVLSTVNDTVLVFVVLSTSEMLIAFSPWY